MSKEMMWDTAEFRLGRTCRSDAHRTVELPRIRTDDLGAQVPAERGGDVCFAGGRGSTDDDQRAFHLAVLFAEVVHVAMAELVMVLTFLGLPVAFLLIIGVFLVAEGIGIVR